MDNDSLINLSKRINKYVNARDWEQFHTPKNLIMAISGEVGELNSLVQWENNSRIFSDMTLRFEKMPYEMADILIYLIRLADQLEIDLIEAANMKINTIDKRYPVDQFKGLADKSDIK